MKKLITILFILIYFLGFSQSEKYIKSSMETNYILFNKFKDHRENHDLYGEVVLDTASCNIIFHKALWQSKGHFASHKHDKNNSWRKCSDKPMETLKNDTLYKWGSCFSREITTLIPVVFYSRESDKFLKDSVIELINSEKFMERVFQNFKNSPGHNHSILNEFKSDLKYTSSGQYVNKGARDYVAISTVADLTNREESPSILSGKHHYTYYVVTTCVITPYTHPIEDVYPVSYPYTNYLNKDYIYTDHNSTLRSRVDEKGRIEVRGIVLGDTWKRISKKKLEKIVLSSNILF